MGRARTARTGWGRSGPIWTFAVVLAVGLLAGSAVATAAKGKADASKSGQAAQEAERTIETGIAALEAGKADLAVQELSSAITGGKISQSALARALYYRGMAYRKQGKPAQAIADLTSALWIKNGLDGEQRANALANRAGAYRDAGLKDQAEADEKRVAAGAGVASQAQTARTTAAASSPSQQAAAPSASGGGLGGFFNSLFGSSPAAQEPVSQGFATSVTPPEASGRTAARSAPAASVSAWSTQANPNAPGWKDSTEVRRIDRSAGTPATTGSTKASVTKAVARTEVPAGRYHVQVAAVRSRQEAQAVAAKLKAIRAAGAERDAAIEEAVVGNMGTLYRVRLGPFASAGEVQSLCPPLRKAGLDCLVIGQ